MKKQTKWIILSFSVILICVLAVNLLARLIFLAPSCFSDNENFTEQENYFIKKVILEAIEDRCSILSESENQLYDSKYYDEIVQLYSPSSEKRLFICINTDFMQSFVKTEENKFIGQVKTFGLEDLSEDCIYEFELDGNEGYKITFWGLNP